MHYSAGKDEANSRDKKALYILSIWVGFGWWESEDTQGQKSLVTFPGRAYEN